MGDEFSWSYSDRAMVLGGFFYGDNEVHSDVALFNTLSTGYTCSQIVGAALSRKYGFKIVLAIAVVGWSLITMATPAIAKHSATAAVFWRVLLGDDTFLNCYEYQLHAVQVYLRVLPFRLCLMPTEHIFPWSQGNLETYENCLVGK